VVFEMQVGPLSRQVAELLARRWGLAAQRAGAVLQAPSLGELAAAAHRTREGFCRAFRTEVGFAPLQALRLIRLERAASLLAEGRLGVAEVAYRCGFPDAFNFSRLFAANYRCPPRDFRAAFQAGKVHARLGGPEAFDRFRLCLVDALQWGR
jgi:AraC-like DNA-binding protein